MAERQLALIAVVVVLLGPLSAALWVVIESILGSGFLEADERENSFALYPLLLSLTLIPTIAGLIKLRHTDLQRRVSWLLLSIAIPTMMLLFGLSFLGNSGKGSLPELHAVIYGPALLTSLAVFMARGRGQTVSADTQGNSASRAGRR